MAYDEKLASRIRESLSGIKKVEEKQMMGGLAFMVNGKMCVGIFKDQLMCRVDKTMQDELLEKPGTELMAMAGRKMNGYIIVDNETSKSKKIFEYWINLSLAYNKFAKSSKKRK